MYAKVFASLWDGTLAEPYSRWAVFVFLLAHADADGTVDMTHEAIARRSCIPLEEVRAQIAHLEQPDPSSRTPTEDGRRLIRIDEHREWGWSIVNYLHYRGLRDAEERRRQTREAVQRHRMKADVSHGKPRKAQEEGEVEAVDSKALVTADAATVSRSPSRAESKANPRREWDDALDLLWPDFPRKVGKPAALRAWRAIKPQTQETFDAIDAGLKRWCAYWAGRERELICHPATWLNQRRWENEP